MTARRKKLTRKSLPGVLSHVAAAPPMAIPVIAPSPVVDVRPSIGSRSVRILGEDNGWGLSRDREILADRFRAAGWRVEMADRRAVMNGAATVDVCVHLEIPVEGVFRAARKNVLVPNPEWWLPEWDRVLRDPSVTVWAKTADTARIFEEAGAARVVYVGFRSLDRMDASVPRERVFLHVAGNSPHKGTDVLLAAWRPDWPELLVAGTDRILRPIRFPPGVRHLGQLADEDLRALQNRCRFHVYLSRYEGFGHAQWEALSCGATVIVPDAPPFDCAEGFLRIPATRTEATRRGEVPGRVTRAEVSREAIEGAVKRALALDETAASAASRAAWQARVADFTARLDSAIADIDDGSRGVRRAARQSSMFAPLSMTLADIPPMRYVGRVNCVTGQGEAARHQIHLLRRHGMRLEVIDAGSCADPDPTGQDAFVQAARKSDPGVSSRGTIFHLQPNTAEPLRHRHPRPHVLVSVWETTRLPEAWVRIINTYDQAWCATAWQMRVYEDSGVDPRRLRLVPFALDPDLYDVSGDVLDDVADKRTYTFSSVFQWSPRKGPEALVEAWVRAFSPKDAVRLVLKTYEGDDPGTSVADRLAKIVRGRPHAPIRLVSRGMSRRDVLAFHRSADCYVSAHAGEGFGLPIAEALLLGRSVVATDWSAPAEYARGLFRGVGYALRPPHGMTWQPFYTSDQRWAEIDVEGLAEAMRDAREGRVRPRTAEIRARFIDLAAQIGSTARAALGSL